MLKLEELGKLEAMMETLKELAKSPVPVVEVHTKIMLVTLHELLRQINPDYGDKILEYE